MNKAISVKFKKHCDDFERKIDKIYKKYENLFPNINLKSEEKKQRIIEKFTQSCTIEKESCIKDIREAIKKFEKRNPKFRLNSHEKNLNSQHMTKYYVERFLI